MSKIGAYLQEHISGDVSLSPEVREAMSRDASILKVVPELVVYPRVTNDIRKIARFSWQLAERGHVLPITARGGGSDQTGAAIGKGVILSFPAQMNRIFEYEPKRRLVRVQPGVMAGTLNDALSMHGASIPALPPSAAYSTIGGAVANNAGGNLSGKYGYMREWVDQLEVILANGEVIQTERLSKRELNRRKGLQTLEGEIYRKIDNLIEDNKDLVAGLAQRADVTNAGYSSVASVKGRDGSMDLTPLFIGSQGTLGIISEMILKTDYVSRKYGVVVAAFEDVDIARSCIEGITRHDPAFLEYFDNDLFEQAARRGRRYEFLQGTGFDVKAVLLIGFDDHGERARGRHVKKVSKLLSGAGAWLIDSEGEEAEELLTMRNALVWTASPDAVSFGLSAAPGGVYIPSDQMDIFTKGLSILSEKYHTPLPIYGRELNSLYYVWPQFNPKRASDKHKMLKFLEDYAVLVQKANGELIGDSGEGRLKANAAASGFDVETMQLFADIKLAFDPYGMLNPGVKQTADSKQLAQLLQSEYSIPSLPNHIPYA